MHTKITSGRSENGHFLLILQVLIHTFNCQKTIGLLQFVKTPAIFEEALTVILLMVEV